MMSCSILLLLCFVGNVGGDRGSHASLVQLKSQFAQVLARAEDSQGQRQHVSHKEAYAAQHEALLGFQKFVTGLVEKTIADPDTLDDSHNTGLNDDEKQAIETILGFISTLYGSARDQHDNDVDEVKQFCEEKFKCCTDILDMGDVVETFKNASASLVTHYQCRFGEDSLYTTQEDVCGDYCTDKRQFDFPECVADGFLCGEDNKYIRAPEGSDELAQMEACLEEVKEWYEQILPPALACREDREEWEGKHDICNGNLEVNERAWCTYAQTHDTVCSDYQACWDDAWLVCQSICPSIEDNVKGRKVCNKTGEQIRCLLEVLKDENPDKKDALEACLNMEYGDDSEWDITCPQEGYEVQPPLPLLPNVDECLEESHLNCSARAHMYRPRDAPWQCFVYGFEPPHTACSEDQGQDFDDWTESLYKFTQSSDVADFTACEE